jgi:hypothetical protein
MAYLLGCACGRQLPVLAGAAGSTILCVCGRSVAVPSLSHLRGLPEVVDPPTATSRLRKTWGGSLGNLFLAAAAVICALGCLFTVLKTAYSLTTLKQVASIITASNENDRILIVLILLDGFVEFCLCAALVVVFVRVSQLKD